MDEIRIVRIPSSDWRRLKELWSGDPAPFRHVFSETSFNRNWTVSLIQAGSNVVGAAIVRRRGRPGSVQVGLEFREPLLFGRQVPWERLRGELPASLRVNADRPDGNPFPPKTGAELERILAIECPESESALATLRSRLGSTESLTARDRAVREQRDAVSLSLEIAGLDSREQLGQAHTVDSSVPFLMGLNRSRVSEAATIRHDSTAFDGWLQEKSETFDVAHFQDGKDPARRVTVLYADKENLEQQLGTDLIYFRHHRPGFILIQYKRMTTSKDCPKELTYYPNAYLAKEIARFRQLPPVQPAVTVADWRLCEDAFFVKLVREDLEKPDANRLVRGMYLPISLVDLLIAEGEAGTRAKGWSAETLSEYLSNDEFLLLAKQGFIGSRGATTEQIQEVVTEALGASRAVVLAVDQTDPTAARRLQHG